MNLTANTSSPQYLRRMALQFAATTALAAMLAGCEPLSLTMLGIGSSAGISHHMNGIAYRTFTEPMPRVQSAALLALKRMDIEVSETEKTDTGALIKAKTANRDIEIELESLTPRATRIRAVARKEGGFFVDGATATEIVSQTGRVLGV
ncbi:MAG: DUF3568 family protein [Betaproteobacteria bacterium]|nr:DUF3568 family protein [Betaproteobacteria bacterium]